MREEREKERLIQRIRLNEKIKKEMENYKEDEDEDEYEIQEDNENEIKLPEIKQSRNVPNNEQNNNFNSLFLKAKNIFFEFFSFFLIVSSITFLASSVDSKILKCLSSLVKSFNV